MKDNVNNIIEQQFRIQMLLEQSQGEITPEIDLMMQELDLDSKSKILWLCKRWEEHILKAEARATKIVTIAKQQASALKTAEWFKKHINALMITNDFKKLSLDEFELSYSKSKGVNIFNESEIPEKYYVEKISESISKTKIKNDINSGIKVPGAEIKEKSTLKIK